MGVQPTTAGLNTYFCELCRLNCHSKWLSVLHNTTCLVSVFTYQIADLYVTQQKSFWTLIKLPFSQKCFILGKLKAYYVKQVNVLCILIPNLKEVINKRVLIIWLETGTFLKKLQMKPFTCTEQVIDEQICMLMDGNICNFPKRTCLHSNG